MSPAPVQTDATPRRWWLFSPALDLAAFGGSALAAIGLLVVGAALGILHDETPDWTWIAAVLLIDVAHVYATAFRVYFDRDEFQRRTALYLLVPLIGWGVGIALYSEGELLFWRVLAYLAVFHFVRQQYGWVALYRARLGEQGRLGRLIDSAAIYLATIYPLVYWHTQLPRNFWWFLEDDFAHLPAAAYQIVRPLYWTALAAYALRSLRAWSLGQGNPGKDLVVVTTALCWHLGIITFNSDYAFTVTNVIIHGVPYMVLLYWYWQLREPAEEPRRLSGLRALVVFLATIWLLAYTEELLWDRGVWHERGWMFGRDLDYGPWKMVLVPLLAVPQLTHYVLDGFIWRRRSNPNFRLERAAEAKRPKSRPPQALEPLELA